MAVKSEFRDGVIRCYKCNSPINETKAARRYRKKHGVNPEDDKDFGHFFSKTVGYCSCGSYIFVHINKV
jgi:hypothetical protein